MADLKYNEFLDEYSAMRSQLNPKVIYSQRVEMAAPSSCSRHEDILWAIAFSPNGTVHQYVQNKSSKVKDFTLLITNYELVIIY
ncbi:hypothetical protein [Nostoc sp. UHCC 0870]|uniref:hypothetical protein n=1 Tax=Nostoc sp. UHCC 0870 TaxID=2914041 RepID=UPI001EE06085|nr:hypothetical protein [Nostoc sp. UHCC 0870]UKO99105.1 hypothetical protein L6494_05120 [Nostoc sp. UHCC 0870]